MARLNYIIKFLYYGLFSVHKNGHGIHSPFIFSFVKEVLMQKEETYYLRNLKKALRNISSKNKLKIVNEGTIWNWHEWSSSDKPNVFILNNKYRRLIHNLATFIDASYIVEIGCQSSISGYLLSVNNVNLRKFVIENCGHMSNDELKSFIQGILGYKALIDTPSGSQLPMALELMNGDFILIVHLNNENTATFDYFNLLFNKCTSESVIILSGIHFNPQFEESWHKIQSADNVRVTIDFFFLGFVFFRKELQKENYLINY